MTLAARNLRIRVGLRRVNKLALTPEGERSQSHHPNRNLHAKPPMKRLQLQHAAAFAVGLSMGTVSAVSARGDSILPSSYRFEFDLRAEVGSPVPDSETVSLVLSGSGAGSPASQSANAESDPSRASAFGNVTHWGVSGSVSAFADAGASESTSASWTFRPADTALSASFVHQIYGHTENGFAYASSGWRLYDLSDQAVVDEKEYSDTVDAGVGTFDFLFNFTDTRSWTLDTSHWYTLSLFGESSIGYDYSAGHSLTVTLDPAFAVPDAGSAAALMGLSLIFLGISRARLR